jgi:putative oxidoreductase
VELLSQMGVAGVLEFFGGLLIVLGLFTRPVAFILSGHYSVDHAMAGRNTATDGPRTARA